jgi:hypothetical protein
MSMLITLLLADVNKGGPGSGPHPGDKMGLPIGARAIRNPKISPKWKDSEPGMRGHNHGSIVSQVTHTDNQDRPAHGFMFRSDNDAKVLKDPNADQWDRRSAERGTFYTVKELVPEKSK